jgi:hypothetical protein
MCRHGVCISLIPVVADHSQRGGMPDLFEPENDHENIFLIAIGAIAVSGLGIAVAALVWLLVQTVPLYARDDGRYSDMKPSMKAWFDQLASGKGLCCSFADGFSVTDVDWDTQDGRYRVRLHGEWIVVPENAVVIEPNRFGPAVVWPYLDAEGATQIRCFLPGVGT